MSAALYHKKLERALARAGDLWTLNDILERIADGRMQHFVRNNSWIITQISVYPPESPRKKVLEIVAAIGDLGDCRVLHREILNYAQEKGVDLIAAFGRLGWARDAEKNGWTIKAISYLYHRKV